MQFCKSIFFLLPIILCFQPNKLISQRSHVSLEIGDHKKTGLALLPPDGVIFHNDSIYATIRTKGLVNLNIYLDVYSRDLKLLQSKKVKGIIVGSIRGAKGDLKSTKNKAFEFVYQKGDALFVFYSNFKNGKSELYRANLDVYTGKRTGEQLIHTDLRSGLNRTFKYYYVESPDSNKRFVLSKTKEKVNEGYQFMLLELDDNLDIINESILKIPFQVDFKRNQFYSDRPSSHPDYWTPFAEVIVLNNGSIGILQRSQALRYGLSNNLPKVTKYPFGLIYIPYKDTIVFKHDIEIDGNRVVDAKIAPFGSSIVCSGFFSEDQVRFTDGIFSLKIDPLKKSLTSNNVIYFTEDQLESFLSGNEDKGFDAKVPENRLYMHHLIDLILLDDFSVVLLTERIFYKSSKSWETTKEYYAQQGSSPSANPTGTPIMSQKELTESITLKHVDIGFSCVDSIGKLKWQANANKPQSCLRNRPLIALSGVSRETEEELLFFYAGHHLQIISVNKKNGRLSRQKGPEMKYYLSHWNILPRTAIQTGKNEFVVLGQNGRIMPIMRIRY